MKNMQSCENSKKSLYSIGLRSSKISILGIFFSGKPFEMKKIIMFWHKDN